MTSIIHKISVLLEITRILIRFLRSIIDFYFFKKNNYFFSQDIMMENLRFEEDEPIEEYIIKDVRNLFRSEELIKKETIGTTIKDIRNIFRLKKENKGIKDIRIIIDIRNLFKHGDIRNIYRF